MNYNIRIIVEKIQNNLKDESVYKTQFVLLEVVV